MLRSREDLTCRQDLAEFTGGGGGFMLACHEVTSLSDFLQIFIKAQRRLILIFRQRAD